MHLINPWDVLHCIPHTSVHQAIKSSAFINDWYIGYLMNRDKLTDDAHKAYTIDEFEVWIMEPEKSSGRWETQATIRMQTFEHALTLRLLHYW